MSTNIPAASTPIIYPESDGKPMSDNDWQARWMVLLYGNFKALFAARPDVYVGMNMMWYPVEGEPTIQGAPDVFVVLGRPKGDRRSWKQWEENYTPLTVVFEILSPSNTDEEMREKFHFYEEHGVQEYYIYDPFGNTLEVYLRGQQTLVRQRNVDGFRSPRLGVRFVLTEPEMTVYYPTGEPFIPFEQVEQLRRQAEQEALQAQRLLLAEQQRATEAQRLLLAEQQRATEAACRAEDEKRRAEDEKRRAEDEKRRAEDEKRRAEDEKRRAEDEKRRAEDEKRRAEDAAQQAATEKRRAEEAEQQVADEKRRAEDEKRRADNAQEQILTEKRRAEEQQRQLARVLELARKARRGQANAAELEELDRLESNSGTSTP